MPARFRDLPQPPGDAVLEVDGVIVYSTPDHPLTTTTYPPFTLIPHNTRPPQRASRLLPSPVPTPTSASLLDTLTLLNPLPLLYRLYTTPTDLLLKHLVHSYANPESPPRVWDTARSGLERIEHTAYHPTYPLLALSTTWARIHIYDLRDRSVGVFAPYFLVAADTPAHVTITSLSWGPSNMLAAGMDNGCIDIWTVDLSGAEPTPRVHHKPLFGLTPTPMRRRAWDAGKGTGTGPFWDTSVEPSPATAAILSDMSGGGGYRMPSPSSSESSESGNSGGGCRAMAQLERVSLIPTQTAQADFVGAITHVVVSPSGRHIAVGTATGGLWIHNTTMTVSTRVYPLLALPPAAAHCTVLTWSASTFRLVAAFASGLVLILPVRENGAGSITIGRAVRFYPSDLLQFPPSHVREVLVVPGGGCPTIILALDKHPGIHVFRLVPESAVVEPAPTEETTLSRLWALAVQAATYLHLVSKPGLTVIHVGSLDTSWTPFRDPVTGRRRRRRRGTWDPDSEPPPATPGYGGLVKHMALDPSGQRLIAVFSGGDLGPGPSVVWFDASSVTASAAALGALGVLKLESQGDGEVGFLAGSVCAGVVVEGGKGVGFFRAVGSTAS